MKYQRLSRGAVAGVVAALLAAGCTVKKDEAPPLIGPSELGKAIAITVTPDVLTQDGVSQSVVRVTVRNQHGQPVPNEALRAEIWVDGTPRDFGTLSARNVVTGGDGSATFAYTAPPAAPVAEDSGTVVDIALTPLNSGNFANSQTRTVTIRLVPPGVIVPPSGLAPHFTASPSSPIQGQPVFFDACRNTALPPCAPANNPVVSYHWDFGDGRTASGQSATHTFSGPANYFVRLTITDSFGRSQSTTQTIAVSQSAAPTAAFVVSPTAPVVDQPVNFNASASTAAAGRRIVNYQWDFGDGTIRDTSEPTTSHSYSVPRTYTVTLVVMDDIGRTATVSTAVTVAGPNPIAAFTTSPSSPTVGQLVAFNASASTPAPGRQIVNYRWDFGNGTTQDTSGPTTTHTYALAGTYTVTLVVTDDIGRTGTVNRTVTVAVP
jgi:PKD repeat protein